MSSHITAKRDPIRPSEDYCYISDSKLAEDVVIDAKWDPAEVLGLEGEDPASDDGEGETIETEEVEEDCAPIRIAIDPGAPTAEEVEEHRAAGHFPYRSWCEWCVKG